MIVALQYLLLLTLLTFAGVAIARVVMPHIIRMRLNANLSTFVLSALILVAIHIGATKKSIMTYDDYLLDAGSYVTNDYVHVAISRATDVMPTSTEILVYYRELTSSNAADWVQFSPTYTFAEHPHDYALANATNYNYLVVANFAPSPTVHTNGVWQARGFNISSRTNTFGFANSKIKTKGDN